MTAKEYLNQAYRLDQRINNKLMQIDALRSLTQKVTSRFKENIVSYTRNVTSLEDTIIRLMEAENELNQQIDDLVDLKREITNRVNTLENIDHRLVLEKRYLCILPWEEIALDMHYSLRGVQSVHTRALAALGEILVKQEGTS